MSQTSPASDPWPYVRGPATWYGFFLVATQIYLFILQGNVIPFLQTEFALTYREVSMHSVAVAVGVIITGLFGRHLTRPLGRKRSLWLGAGGLAAGAFLLCLSPGPWLSIPGCLLLGLSGGLIGSGVPAMLSELHGPHRAQALAEQSIVAYGFALLGPLAMGVFVSAGLGWRAAVILGGVIGLALIVLFRSTPIPESAPRPPGEREPLPAPFWAYWALLACSCAMEFSVLLWAPTFLERVIGFSTGAAAGIAAGFFLGVLAGRLMLRVLLRKFSPVTILWWAFTIGFVGFALYWFVGTQWSAVIGIFMLGLCIAPQYPLSMTLGIGAAKGANDMAAVRLVLAFGLAILIAPAALGALADVVGLRLAHLTVPLLILAAIVSLTTAGILERRAAANVPA